MSKILEINDNENITIFNYFKFFFFFQYKNYFWLNLYGAHPDKSKTKYGKLMDINPSLGSYWKGRLLLSIDFCKTDSPQLSDPKNIEKIDQKDLKKISMGTSRWQLTIAMFYGCSFPKKDKKYLFKVTSLLYVCYNIIKGEMGRCRRHF